MKSNLGLTGYYWENYSKLSDKVYKNVKKLIDEEYDKKFIYCKTLSSNEPIFTYHVFFYESYFFTTPPALLGEQYLNKAVKLST